MKEYDREISFYVHCDFCNIRFNLIMALFVCILFCLFDYLLYYNIYLHIA